MANKKIQATATLFLDTKDAQNDAKKFVNDLKQKLSEVETAADKMTVFKDMVEYIAQVDRALAALRAKNGDAFNSMFDGLDLNLKKQFEELFGVDGGKLGQLDVLREKLNNLTPKSSMDEIRELASAIKDLYASVEKTPPTLEFDAGHSQKAKTEYIQQLTDAAGNFATVWKDVNVKISQGFGGTGGGKGSQANEDIKKQIKNLESQLIKYKQVKEELQKLAQAKETFVQDEWLDDSVSIEYSVEAIKQLVVEYRAAKKAKEDFEKSSK